MKFGKRVFLLSSPEGNHSFEKAGFISVGKIKMDLEKFGGEGVLIQTAMIWDGGKRVK
jgi:hypothetical protein